MIEKGADEPVVREPEPQGSDDAWSEFKQFVKSKSQPLWAKIEPGKLLGFGEGTLRVGFPKGYLFLDYFDEKPQREKIEEMAREFFRQPVTLIVETVENGRGERLDAERPEPEPGKPRSKRGTEPPAASKGHGCLRGSGGAGSDRQGKVEAGQGQWGDGQSPSPRPSPSWGEGACRGMKC